ncbi:MAG: efflux RND transporter periplasmic adaptor subunit [Prevotella sp.]|jgi:membrane fusion protein (multidrug efflux system)
MKSSINSLKVTMFILLLLPFCSCSKKQQAQSASTYKTLTVSKSSATFQKEYSCTLQGVQAVEVRPQVSGTIKKICVREGANVKKGQVMFIIDQVPYKAAVANARATVANAKASVSSARLTLKSKEQLRKDNVVSDYDVEQALNSLNEAVATLQSAQAQLTSAVNDLSYTEVRSPADGVIGMIPYREGALVSSSIEEPLATVSDNSEVHAYFSISEAEAQKLISQYGSLNAAIKQMPTVQLRMSDGSVYEGKGKVDAVSGNVDSETGAVTIRASFSNSKGLLRNGGTGTILMPYEVSNSIIIPQEATYELQDKIFVYRVVNGKTKSTAITVLDYDDGTHYVVSSGLKVGDVIIAEGAGLLQEGIEVKARK